MKIKNLIIPLYLFATCAAADGKPARNYTTVNLDDRLTCTLLNVSPTSFTFSVEWSPGVEFPEGTLHLMSKLDTKEPYWDNAVGLYINPTDRTGDFSNEYYSRFPLEGGLAYGKVIFEILDGTFPSLYQEEMALASKITFSVTIPDPNFTGMEAIEAKLRAMTPEELLEFGKQLDEELKAPIEPVTKQMPVIEDEQGEEKTSSPNRWGYFGALLLALCAVFYFMRKKKTMKTKCLFLALICLLASHATAALTPEQKADFLRVFKSYSHPQFEHPDERKIEVFFFDLDGDGVEEAIASNNATVDIFAYTRHVYALANGTWVPVKKIREHRHTPSPISFFGAQSNKVFKLTEGDKPPQLVIVDGEYFALPAIEDGFLTVKWLPISQLFEFERDSLVKLEQLTSEIYTAPPSPKEEGENVVMLPEKINPETEPWIDDPSAVPLPSNGLWHPERIRYVADFSNDGIPDILLGHGHVGSQLDRDYTLYLGNAEGKYRRHAVFQGTFHPEFAIENRTDGKVLLWLLMRKNQKITLGYYVITDKGVSGFATDETFADDEEGKAEALKALNYYRLKRNWSLNKIAVMSDTLLNTEVSETIQGKVHWRDNKYMRSKEEPAEQEKKEEDAPDVPILTREEIIQPDFGAGDLDGSRLYAEIDLNDDGLLDIIISDAWYTKGNGGVGWSVYLCVSTNQYKKMETDFGGWPLAVEQHYDGERKRIWGYWRIGGGNGVVEYFYIENNEIISSPKFGLRTGDAGTDTGNDIMDAIFKGKCLKFKQTPPDEEEYDFTPFPLR